MGWSCRQDAGKVVDLWTAKCIEDTGKHVYLHEGRRYFFEISRKEHEDGAITGSILEIGESTGKPDGSFLAWKRGTFKISGDGKVVRGPAFLKKLAEKAATLTASQTHALSRGQKI